MTTAANPSSWFVDWIREATENNSGVTVNAYTAKTYSTVWHALRIISGDVRSAPINVYRRVEDFDRIKDMAHPAYQLLNVQASPLSAGGTLRETMQSQALLFGNSYAEIIRNNAGTPVELQHLHPAYMKVELDGKMLTYTWTDPDTQDEKVLMPDEVLHIKGLSDDTIVGHSVIALARESIGLGLAEQRHGSSTFKNAARPDIALKTARRLDKEEADLLLANWEKRHSGANNTGRPALLGGDLEIETIPSSSNIDAEWLSSRQFQRDEIASWFCIPADKLNGGEGRTSYNSLEMSQKEYVSQTLRYWFHVWEDEVYLKLVAERDRPSIIVEHNASKLIELDVLTKTQVLTSQIASKIINRNEARRELNMNAVDGGDEFENPNTSSGSSGGSDISEEQEEQLENQLVNTIVRMSNNERNQLVRAAKNETEFLRWTEGFFVNWEQNLAKALTDPVNNIRAFISTTMDSKALARKLVEQSKQRIVDIAGYSFPDSLHENISDNWSVDARAIVKELMERSDA